MYDIIIKNGRVLDGSGNDPFQASVGIAGDKIVKVGDISDSETASTIIDANGCIVAPGFIDSHTHDDAGLIHDGGHMRCKLSQGVTTVIIGNCGASLMPLDLSSLPVFPPGLAAIGAAEYWRFRTTEEFVKEVEAHPPTINFALLIGHGTLRIGAMGLAEAVKRPAAPKELEVMKSQLEEGLRNGAIGLSTGLFYPTGNPAPTSEVIALTDVVANFGGIYASHIRDEADKVIESVEEALNIGKSSKVPVVISHHKSHGTRNYGKVNTTLKMIDESLSSQQVHLDVYPYTAASTLLNKAIIDDDVKVIITRCTSIPEAVGADLRELATKYGVSIDEMIQKLQPAGAVYFYMDEKDVTTVMKHKHAMIGSDGLYFDEHPHPRLWGCFPRVLAKYSRETGLLGLPEAIRKMTSLTASTYGLAHRGVIAAGYFADITIFDPNTIADTATYEKPISPTVGIKKVLVNGKVVYEGEKFEIQATRPGRLLRREKA